MSARPSMRGMVIARYGKRLTRVIVEIKSDTKCLLRFIRAFCIQRTGGPAHPSAPADLS